MEGMNPANIAALPIYEGELISVGLTKREYFASIALQGLLANPNVVGVPAKLADKKPVIEGGLEALAVELADDLIGELNKPVE